MNDRSMEKLICESAPAAPDLWGRIKIDIAQGIAADLMESLETITNPCGREICDKKDEMVEIFQNSLKRGA